MLCETAPGNATRRVIENYDFGQVATEFSRSAPATRSIFMTAGMRLFRGRLVKCRILCVVVCVVYVQYKLHHMCMSTYIPGQQDQTSRKCIATPSPPPWLVPTCPQPLQKLYNISCSKIISGDPDYLQQLKDFKFHRRKDNCDLHSLVDNCTKLSHLHGYSGKLVTAEEKEFPLAFGIKVHKDPLQAEQLLRTIYRPHNVYCIHVDLKANKSVSDPLRKLAGCFDNIYVLQKYRVVYSSIRQPLSDVACMKHVIKSKVRWKYYLILAGQEFVIKSNLELVQILKAMNGRNDIEMFPYPKREMKRFIYRHIIKNDVFTHPPKSFKTSFKHNIPIYKGSSYATMTRDFVQFVLTSAVSRDLFQWAEDVFAPEEMVWATLNALPEAPGGYNVSVKHIDDQFLSRATIWKAYDKPCYGKYVRWICIFGYRDLPWLVSSPEMVANKFHSDFDQLAVDCLEEWLHNKTMSGETVNLNWFHYRNAPHVKARGLK